AGGEFLGNLEVGWLVRPCGAQDNADAAGEGLGGGVGADQTLEIGSLVGGPDEGRGGGGRPRPSTLVQAPPASLPPAIRLPTPPGYQHFQETYETLYSGVAVY